MGNEGDSPPEDTYALIYVTPHGAAGWDGGVLHRPPLEPRRPGDAHPVDGHQRTM